MYTRISQLASWVNVWRHKQIIRTTSRAFLWFAILLAFIVPIITKDADNFTAPFPLEILTVLLTLILTFVSLRRAAGISMLACLYYTGWLSTVYDNLTVPHIVKTRIQQTVIIRREDGSMCGCGLQIGQSILTAQHLLIHAQAFQTTQAYDFIQPSSFTKDLMVLSSTTHTNQHLPPLASKPYPNTRLWLSTHAYSRLKAIFVVSPPLILQHEPSLSKDLQNPDLIFAIDTNHREPIRPGFSGTAVFDDSGALVGVISAQIRAKGTNYVEIVSTRTLLPLLLKQTTMPVASYHHKIQPEIFECYYQNSRTYAYLKYLPQKVRPTFALCSSPTQALALYQSLVQASLVSDIVITTRDFGASYGIRYLTNITAEFKPQLRVLSNAWLATSKTNMSSTLASVATGANQPKEFTYRQ